MSSGLIRNKDLSPCGSTRYSLKNTPSSFLGFPMPLSPQKTFATPRFHMIEAQLRANKVQDERLLAVMGSLPREMFVPPLMASLAYRDEDIEIAPHRFLPPRFLIEPMVLGRLLQEARLTPQDRVLDIAPATGYSTAVLSALAHNVVALESDRDLAQTARENLKKTENALVVEGDLAAGWPAFAPYNLILINGSVERLPEDLTAQLAEGGRLAVVMRLGSSPFHVGEARLYEKRQGALSYRSLFNANIPLLEAFAATPMFVL